MVLSIFNETPNDSNLLINNQKSSHSNIVEDHLKNILSEKGHLENPNVSNNLAAEI